MDTGRFDDLLRLLSESPSRRGIARAMGGLILARSLGPLLGLTDGEAGKKKKRCKCKACRKCKKGKCKPQPDDTPCLGTGRCLKGQCNPLPICVRALDACPPEDSPVDCCSGHCTDSPSFVGPLAPPFVECSYSGAGAPCIDSDDCVEGTCVGYRCQAA
jgi:hypothetical protein